MSIKNFKQELARALDDNLHTRQWHNIVDWLIVAMILLSTIEIFLSTFDLAPEVRRVLYWVDIVTLIFFIVEVSLRIWVAPCVNPKFRGIKGRLKYCFTFYGAIDVLSTFPFYLQWIFPLPVAAFKAMRTARVVRTMRIGRYSKSFNLLSNAVKEKRRELIVSMQFLLVVTVILSLILFFAEHEAQPDVYRNGFISTIWAFAQYIGDPGQFADTPPITHLGRIIACIVGLLGIAIVAVPAGIIGAGFTEALEKEAHKENMNENRANLVNSFERKLDRPTGLQVVPPYRTLPFIQARHGMTADDIINTVQATPGFRLINLASTEPMQKRPVDCLAVECFDFNRPYGLLIDRDSAFTVIAPSSLVDPCTRGFAYYLAAMGGFNFISREFGDTAPYVSLYIFKDGHKPQQGEEEYFSDIRTLLSRPGAASLTLLVASGANEPEYPTQLHFGTGNPKGDESVGPLVTDKERFQTFYQALASDLKENMNFECDYGKFHSTASPALYLRRLGLTDAGCNHIILRVAWSAMLWSPQSLLLAREIADHINRFMLGLPGNPENPQLTEKAIGY